MEKQRQLDRFIAFDVETPNFRNDRMSAIGIAVVEKGEITEEFYSLVNPEARFDRFNVELTGITPEMAETAPRFDELWETIGPILSSGLPVAHNAPFDMSVLAKCIRAYCIDFDYVSPYVCTCQMGRRLMPGLPDHRLNTMCAFCGIELDHHHAGSDSRACAELLCRYLKSGADVRKFVRYFDMREMKTVGKYR